jgi:hypothetical protein
VHAVFAKSPHVRAIDTKIRTRCDALLRGLLHDLNGVRMYATYTKKDDRIYRYYVTKSEMRFGAKGKTHERIPAEEIEAATVVQIKTVLTSPEAIASVCHLIQKTGAQVDEATAVMTMRNLGGMWEQLYEVERHRIVNLMIERVDLATGGLRVKWNALGWRDIFGEFAPNSIGTELLEMEVAP